MPSKTKIQFSEFEEQLLQNADLILTKNAILEKMKWILQECLDNQIELLRLKRSLLPDEIFKIAPKVSRGENYKGLPWLMLDHPRLFDRDNTFAIRTLFWWGRCFSITLHLSGKYKDQFTPKIGAAYRSLAANNFYYCINSDEWEHHFEETNYKMIRSMTEAEFKVLLDEKKFIKLSARIELSNWQQLPVIASGINAILLEILC